MHHNHCQTTMLLAHDPPFIVGLHFDYLPPSPSLTISLLKALVATIHVTMYEYKEYVHHLYSAH